MAENDKEEDQGRAPPKIHLEGIGGSPEPEPEKDEATPSPPPSDSKTPPRLKIKRPGADQQDPPAAARTSTPQQSAMASSPKKETTKIDLEAAESPPKVQMPLQGRKLSSAKSDTSRIDLSEAEKAAMPGKAAPPSGETRRKAETTSLADVDEEALERAIQEKYQAAKERTQRVTLEEPEKEQTSRLGEIKAVDDEEKDAAKQRTMAIRPDARGDEKHRTRPIQPPSEGDEDEASRPPTTIKVKKPPLDQETSGTTIAIPDYEESRKSETARIDLPKGVASAAPPTQRKTIRIKRPDGTTTTRPAMSVARPQKGATPSAKDEEEDVEQEDVSTVTTVMALVATLVAIALVYVMAAMLIPELPFPGRLV